MTSTDDALSSTDTAFIPTDTALSPTENALSPTTKLETLPIDIHFEILSYLCAPYADQRSTGLTAFSKEDQRRSMMRPKPPLKYRHPYQTLAATCRSLEGAVELFSHHLLRTVSDLLPYKVPIDYVPMEKRPRRRGRCCRQLWYRWARIHCAFCGKATSKKAVFNQLLICCKLCDREQWPYLIGFTDAKNEDQLSKLDLFLPNPAFPEDSPFSRFAPKCKHSMVNLTYKTALFREDDVLALAKYIHGNDDIALKEKRANMRERWEKKITWLPPQGLCGKWTGIWNEEAHGTPPDVLDEAFANEMMVRGFEHAAKLPKKRRQVGEGERKAKKAKT